VFAGHPLEKTTYFPIADFHRALFEDKFCEIIDILIDLGANKITVKHVVGWGQDISGKIAIGIPDSSAKVESGTKNKEQSEILYEAELSGGPPSVVIENLKWYPNERAWQQVVKARTKKGLRNFRLNLLYQQDFGVNASLNVEVQKVGLEVGGEFQSHRSTIWEIQGTFAASGEVPASDAATVYHPA
jgi:hypothetical protein